MQDNIILSKYRLDKETIEEQTANAEYFLNEVNDYLKKVYGEKEFI